MDILYFLQLLADTQEKYGRAVSIIEILEHTTYSRQTGHKYMTQLIKRNYAVRISHGKYAIKSDDNLLTIGLLVVLPMDVYEYHSKKEMLRVS